MKLFFYILVLTCCFSCNETEKKNEVVKEKVKMEPRDARFLSDDVLKNYVKLAKKVTRHKNAGLPFGRLDYDKVIAYDYEGEGEHSYSVFYKNEFVPVILKQQYLTAEQSKKMIELFSSKETYGGGVAACFEPHLGFVFYKNNKKVGSIDVCLGCNFLESDPHIPAQDQFINPGTDSSIAVYGFSRQGRSGIIGLCKELGFYYGTPEFIQFNAEREANGSSGF
ncbi:MAG TPA: hypothetical protein VK177_00615 [Flavobacteriales bacterium]|nr:hypothetical protein [Flavobacteriales bacterium]